MYKHHNFNSKEHNQIKQIYKDIAEHFQFYELKSEITYPTNYRPSIIATKQTLDYYHQHHNYLDIKDLNKLKPFLNSLRHHDKLFKLDDNLMLFHSYKLIGFIEKYTHTLVVYEQGDFLKNTFASLRGDSNEYRKKYAMYNNARKKPDNFLTGEDYIKAVISRFYSACPPAMDMFMNLNTLIPQHQIKEFQNNTLEVNIMKRLYEYYGSTNVTSHQPILKSIAIVVASYLKFKLKMSHNDILHSLDLLFNDYFYELSDGKYESPIKLINNHLFTNTYIKSRINMVPIFGSSQKPLKNDEHIRKLDWVLDSSQKELGVSLETPISRDLNPFENPLTVFLSITPMELLQQTR
jgi:hypothetical protein